MLPGLALAMALGLDPSIGGVISGLVGAIAAESLTNKKNQNYEAVMNTILAGSWTRCFAYTSTGYQE